MFFYSLIIPQLFFALLLLLKEWKKIDPKPIKTSWQKQILFFNISALVLWLGITAYSIALDANILFYIDAAFLWIVLNTAPILYFGGKLQNELTKAYIQLLTLASPLVAVIGIFALFFTLSNWGKKATDKANAFVQIINNCSTAGDYVIYRDKNFSLKERNWFQERTVAADLWVRNGLFEYQYQTNREGQIYPLVHQIEVVEYSNDHQVKVSYSLRSDYSVQMTTFFILE